MDVDHSMLDPFEPQVRILAAQVGVAGIEIRAQIRRIDQISAAAAKRRAEVTLASGQWQRLNEPTVEAVTALARNRGEPGRIYAGALFARRVLRGDADLARQHPAEHLAALFLVVAHRLVDGSGFVRRAPNRKAPRR